jgi:hypothetical protein
MSIPPQPRKIAPQTATNPLLDLLFRADQPVFGAAQVPLGFERIGTHRHGELACASSRSILILDIARAYQRLALSASA